MYDTPQVDERYTDQARIHVKVIGNDRLTPPSEEWFVTVNSGERTDRAFLRDALLEALAPPDYELSEQHNVVHWGAAGASYDLIMSIAGGAGGTIAAAKIMAFLDRISELEDNLPIAEDDAVQTARSRLCRRYNVGFNDLALVSAQNDFEKNRATVLLRGPDNIEYMVEVYRHNQRVTVAKVSHRRNGDDPE